MRSLRTFGSVGRAPGNWCLYPEPDCRQPSLLRRYGFRQQVKPSVRCQKKQFLSTEQYKPVACGVP
jgi:hypothetical protein